MDPLKTLHHRRSIAILGLILLLGMAAWLLFTAEVRSIFQPRVIEISSNSQKEITPASDNNLPGLTPLDKKSGPTVNFLLLGAPGQGNDAPDLTDTILLARLDEKQNKIFLFSLPRDLLVKIPGSENYTKLNALYAFNKNNAGHEFDSLITKAQEITGLAIDHHVFVDLQAVKQLVDVFGGVNIMVAEDIIDPSFPGANHSFTTFTIQAGWRYLDGETALKYMRTRSSLAGDFDRTARQQEVLQALKQKVLTLNFWDIGKFLDIYNALSRNIKSDLNLWQIKNYWDRIKNIPGTDVAKNELGKADLLISGQANLGGTTASILQPKAGIENYGEIREYIQEIINK